MKYIVLSVVIGLFCVAGQAYAQTPEQLRADLPEIEGWVITPDIEIFDQNNLYERINGAAPLFFENNFREMTSMEYVKGDDYITIQAYRHATPEDAFGMYASERSSDMQHANIGGEGQGDDYGFYFFSGPVYVKMHANNESEYNGKIMREIARGMAEKIDPTSSYPPIVKAFPPEGKLPYTESYITVNYIGHEFLKPAYTCNYIYDGKPVQLFVIDGKSKEGAASILKSYFNFTKQAQDFSEGKLLITDKYNGNIPVIWKGQYIIGAFNDAGDDFPESIYDVLNQVKL